MENLPSGFFGFVGLFIGSFLNVCIYRLPRYESLVWPGSHCPACGRRLTAIDLVPVLSYIALRGRCRRCGVGISPRYPLIELLTGVAFYWAAGYSGGNWEEMAAACLLLSGLIVVFFTDLDYWIIPDRVVVPLAVAGLALSIFREPTSTALFLETQLSGAGLDLAVFKGMFLDSICASAAGFFGFYGIAILGTALFRKDAMGGGDIKLAGVIGLYLGMQNMLTGFFLAFLFGTVVSLPLLLNRNRKTGDPIPFGPMMAMGAAVALLKGPDILEWYGGLMVNLWL